MNLGTDTSEILDREQLRARYYNAVVTRIVRVHEDLMRITVQPDFGPLAFSPGQYATLGLGAWEDRAVGCQAESLTEPERRKLIRRAYSISSPLVDALGRPCLQPSDDELEFYIVLVRQAASRPPALTPRLFLLREGNRLAIHPHPHGSYTLKGVQDTDTVILASTGTGEAPHNAMIADLMMRGHQGSIACVSCVRYRRDHGYVDEHRRLEDRFSNYRFVSLTTREPENLDPKVSGYVGKRYLQDYFSSGDFTRDTGIRLQSNETHVFLCGAPEMIGVPLHTHDPARRYPRPLGMVEILERHGFVVDVPHEPGTIHFEKYW
jgi:ferredoxin--NADP+ reductase